MKNKKTIFAVVLFGILVTILTAFHMPAEGIGSITLGLSLKAGGTGNVEAYYGNDENFSAMNSSSAAYRNIDNFEEMEFLIGQGSGYLRMDFMDWPCNVVLKDMYFEYRGERIVIDVNGFYNLINKDTLHNVEVVLGENQEIYMEILGQDPYFVLDISSYQLDEFAVNLQKEADIPKKIALCVVLILLLLVLIKYASQLSTFFHEIVGNRTLIFRLAKNDFKTKFSGSYLGIFWAFVQPIVTVLVYWFAFQVGFRSGNVGDFPFVLWLVSGLVPWFFFSEALNSATNAFIEYNYLVKKVVFKISILPVVKTISALFVHLFFAFFTLILFACYGYFPDLYSLQIVYYSFCVFVFVLGISYVTSAIVVFFRDLTQIISIILQVLVWLTPIMWNISTLPESLVWFFKLNPLYYIVFGYRSALMDKTWFWKNYYMTGYFWIVTLAIFGIGILLFKRLREHFADVL